MDLNYIRNLTIQKRGKAKHLYAAISLLLVAAILMSTATYAWLILSTAPELSSVTTAIGANGNLEIALSTANHLASLASTNMYEEESFFEYATGDPYHDNVLWGNIIDLEDVRYGLSGVILRPSMLNIMENVLQLSNPLITVSYGEDGRIAYEDTYSGVGGFDPESQSYLGNKGKDYGVRVAGTPLDAELMQRVAGLASSAKTEATTLLSRNTNFLLDVCYYEDASLTTDTVELRGFIDSVLELDTAYKNAVDAIESAFGSEAPDPEEDALLKEIQEYYKIASGKLEDADKALKLYEAVTEDGEPKSVELSLDTVREIIMPLFGDLTFYTREYSEEQAKYIWVPIAEKSSRYTSLRVELGQNSYFHLLGALSGSYAISGEFSSGSQGSAVSGTAEWAAVIEDYSQVFKLESETMASKYEVYLEEYEAYSQQLNTYADKIENLVNREYQDEVKFFYEYALHPLPDPETGLPDETTQPFTPEELEAYVSNIDSRVNELEEIVTFLEDYTKAAVMVYASSGILDRETFQNVEVADLTNGSLRMHLEAAELMGNADFVLILEKSENARASIADWRKGVEELNKELNPKNENGNIIIEQVRDMSVADLLKVWDHVEDMTGINVDGYGPEIFAQNARKIFVQRISSISPGGDGLYQLLSRLQKSAWGTRSVDLSDITYRENSDAQYLPGVNVSVSVGSWYYYKELNLNIKEIGELPDEDFNACALQYSRNRLADQFKDLHDTELWRVAYSDADSAIETLNSLQIATSGAQIISDAVAERVTSGAEDGYSSAYYDLMISLVADTETIMDHLEDALAKQVLLYAAGMAAREMAENTKATENTEPDSADNPTEPKTEYQDLYAEAKEAWGNGEWTLDQLLQKVDFPDERAFDTALEIYRNSLPIFSEAQDALGKLEKRELSWIEIDSVLSNYWIDDEVTLVEYSSVYPSIGAGVFADVQYAMNEFYQKYVNLLTGEERGPSPYGYNYRGLPADIDERYCNVGLTDVEQKLETHISYIVEDPLYQIEKLIDRTEDGQGNTMSDREFVFRNETAQMESAQALIERYYAEYAETEEDLLSLLYRCGVEYYDIPTKQEEKPYTTEEINNFQNSLEKLSRVVEAASECLVHTLRASAASSSTEESVYQTAIQLNDADALLKALNFGEGHDLYKLNQDLAEIRSDIQYANQGITLAKSSFDEPDQIGTILTQQVFGFLSPVQDMKVNGMSVPEFYDLLEDPDAPYIQNGEEMTVLEMLVNQYGIHFVAASGTLSKARGLFGTGTGMEEYYVDQISLEYVSLPISISTGITLTGTLSNSVSWVYASGTPTDASESGGVNADSNYIIGSTYAVAIDFLLRTNAPFANLLLQTEGIQRIYSEETLQDNDRFAAEEIEEMRGNGSYIQLFNDDPKNDSAWTVLQNPEADERQIEAARRKLGSEILEAIRVVFADTLTGEVYAHAGIDMLDFDYENHTIKGELVLVDEWGYKLQDAILKPMPQNQVSALTAWIYLDGSKVDNASVDSENLGALTVNLQFATDTYLNPAYSDNEELTLTPPQLDQPGTTPPVASDKFYVESNGGDTYAIYTLNSAGNRDYQMSFTGSMDSDTGTVVVDKVTQWPNDGTIVIPALTYNSADNQQYSVNINPNRPFDQVTADEIHLAIIPVEDSKVGVAGTSLGTLFGSASYSGLEKRGTFQSVELNGLDTSAVTDMSFLFYYCSNLKTLDVSGLDTSSVTDMSYLFCGCSSLPILDVSDWDTGNVTTMSRMFLGCSGLMELDVSGFDTANVTDMEAMFQTCSGLTELDITGFDTTGVNSIQDMFSGCSSLTELDVTGFDTTNVTDMWGTFEDCSSLTELNVSNFDTSNVTSMGYMFCNCSSLKELDVSNFDTTNVGDMSNMFGGCQELKSLDVSGFDTANVVSMLDMFRKCSKLTTLDVSGFDTSNVSSMFGMFYDCYDLNGLDVSKWNTAKVRDFMSMFCLCESLTAIDVSSWDTSACERMERMFSGCKSLTEVDIRNWDMSNVTNSILMFYECPATVLRSQ